MNSFLIFLLEFLIISGMCMSFFDPNGIPITLLKKVITPLEFVQLFIQE